MSATETIKTETPETPKLSAGQRKGLYGRDHSQGIKTAAAAMHAAEETLAERQRAVGRVVSSAVVAWVAAGGTADEVQKLILADIGGDYSWSYVASWQRAAVVFDSLTAENQRLYGDSTESLKSLGGISDEKKRNALASKLAKNGKPAGVRAIREAVAKAKPASKRKRATTAGANTLVTKLAKVRSEVKTPPLVARAWTPALQDYVTELALIAARAAKQAKQLNTSEREAVSTLVYFGPKSDDDKTETPETPAAEVK